MASPNVLFPLLAAALTASNLSAANQNSWSSKTRSVRHTFSPKRTKEERKRRKAQKIREQKSPFLKIRDGRINDKRHWYSWADNHFSRVPKFGLRTYGCFRSFFPEAPEPKHGAKTAPLLVDDDSAANAFLIIPSAPTIVRTSLVGCSAAHVKYRDNFFLLRSEMTMKNETRGVAAWTVIKNRRPSRWWYRMYYQMVTYVVFLEKESSGWRIKSGFSWGPKSPEDLFTAGGIKVVFPLGDEVKVNLNTNTGGKFITRDFYGVWVEGDGHSKEMFLLDPHPHPKSGPYSSILHDVRTLKGYDTETNIVHNPNNIRGSHWSWHWLKIENGTGKTKPIHLPIKSTVEGNFSHFDGNSGQPKGAWYKMNDYCRRNTKNQDPLLVNTCNSWFSGYGP